MISSVYLFLFPENLVPVMKRECLMQRRLIYNYLSLLFTYQVRECLCWKLPTRTRKSVAHTPGLSGLQGRLIPAPSRPKPWVGGKRGQTVIVHSGLRKSCQGSSTSYFRWQVPLTPAFRTWDERTHRDSPFLTVGHSANTPTVTSARSPGTRSAHSAPQRRRGLLPAVAT